MSVDLFHDPVIRTGNGVNKKRRMRLWWRFADGTETAPLVKAGSRQDIYQFGRENDPATLITRDADSNEIVMYLYGPVVKLNDTLTIDVGARTVALDTGEGYANTWGGELPGVQSGSVTVEYNDDAIGAVTMTTTPRSGYM